MKNIIKILTLVLFILSTFMIQNLKANNKTIFFENKQKGIKQVSFNNGRTWQQVNYRIRCIHFKDGKGNSMNTINYGITWNKSTRTNNGKKLNQIVSNRITSVVYSTNIDIFNIYGRRLIANINYVIEKEINMNKIRFMEKEIGVFFIVDKENNNVDTIYVQ